MFIILYSAISNDTYESQEFTLKHCENPDDEENPVYNSIFEELPEDIREAVKSTYDGVWEPVLDTIRAFELKEVKI